MQKFIIIILFILLAIGMGVYLFIDPPSISLLSLNRTDSSPNLDENNASDPPIPVDSSDIVSVSYFYTIQAPVKEFKKFDTNYELKLATTNEKVPTFLVSEEVVVNKASLIENNQISKPASASADLIKTGTLIRVSAYYNLSDEQWIVPVIDIVE